jgi:hypothetical protein
MQSGYKQLKECKEDTNTHLNEIRKTIQDMKVEFNKYIENLTKSN